MEYRISSAQKVREVYAIGRPFPKGLINRSNGKSTSICSEHKWLFKVTVDQYSESERGQRRAFFNSLWESESNIRGESFSRTLLRGLGIW